MPGSHKSSVGPVKLQAVTCSEIGQPHRKNEMAHKLPILVDKKMEALSGISFEACAAYFDEVEGVRVLGEVVTASGEPIKDYREIQVVVYDENGDILGREYTNWTSFQLRQSFEIQVLELHAVPARVRVFPSRSD